MSTSSEGKPTQAKQKISIEKGQAMINKLNKLLKAALDLKPDDNLVLARRELAGPSVSALARFK